MTDKSEVGVRVGEQWWKTIRATKVVELKAGNPRFMLDYYQYHNTKVVEMYYKMQTIVLHSGGFHTRTTKERMNQCAMAYNLPFFVWADSGDWFVTLVHERVSSRDDIREHTVPFKNGMEIPFHPQITPVPHNPTTSSRWEHGVNGSAMYVKFWEDDQQRLHMLPSEKMDKKLKAYLNKFNAPWTGEVVLPAGSQSAYAIKHNLNRVQEGRMRDTNFGRLGFNKLSFVSALVNVEEWLRRYVGYDSELWLTQQK